MSPFHLLVAALATWQAVEIWHHGSLFATRRARLELSETRFAQLLLCPFCLSVWVGLVFAGAFVDLPTVLDRVVQYFGYMLAVSRLANLGNDVFHSFTRTHHDNPAPGPPTDV